MTEPLKLELSVAQELRKARRKAGLSVAKAARRAGISWHTWNALENPGGKSASLNNASRALESLGVL